MTDSDEGVGPMVAVIAAGMVVLATAAGMVLVARRYHPRRRRLRP